MKQLKYILFAFTLLTTQLITAQCIGVEVGYSFTNFSQSNTVAGVTSSGETAYLNGFHAGPQFQIPITDRFALNAALLYEMRAGRYDIDWYMTGTTNTRMLHYLVIPLQLEYKFPINEKAKLIFFAGPQLNRGLFGSVNEHYYLATKDEVDYSNAFDSIMNPIDFSASLGLGVELGNFKIKADYAFGLSNSINKGNPTNLYQNVLQVSFAYYFRKKNTQNGATSSNNL